MFWIGKDNWNPNYPILQFIIRICSKAFCWNSSYKEILLSISKLLLIFLMYDMILIKTVSSGSKLRPSDPNFVLSSFTRWERAQKLMQLCLLPRTLSWCYLTTTSMIPPRSKLLERHNGSNIYIYDCRFFLFFILSTGIIRITWNIRKQLHNHCKVNGQRTCMWGDLNS